MAASQRLLYGVAVLCEILTDNKNRTAPEIRKIFEICGGKLGGTGCVAYLFERKGVIRLPLAACDEDRVMELALEAGADDVKRADDQWEIVCDPAAMSGVLDALKAAALEPASNEMARIPTNTVDVDDVETARKVLNLMERLDDHDDVQSVAANFSIPDAALAELS